MPEPRPNPDSHRDTGGRGSTTGTPSWVKVFAIIALALVLLFVIVMLAGGGGGHGPGRHTLSDRGPGDQTPPSRATEHGVQQP